MSLQSFTVTIITKSDSPFNVIPSAPIDIRERLSNGSSGTLSLIFSDQAGTISITQPGALANSLGQFTFFAAAADYNAVYDNNGTPVTIAVDVGVTSTVMLAAIDDTIDRLNPDTLAIWQADSSALADDVVTTKERSTGTGGGATGDVIAGIGTANGFGNVANNANTLTWVLRQHPDNTIDMYGAASGATSSDAINAAIAVHVGQLKAERTGYILDSQVVFASGPCTGLKGIGQIDCLFIKAFNGEAMRLQNQGCQMSDFGIIGDGGTYTGGGIYVQPDDCRIERVRITATADSPILCKGDDSAFLVVDDCFLQGLDTTLTSGIRSDAIDNILSPTARIFSRIKGGAALVDFSGMNRALLINSFGTLIRFSTNSDKIGIHNNRFTNAGNDITVLGNTHTFTGNMFGFGLGKNLIIDSTCEAIRYDDSNVLSINAAANSTIQDDSATGNVGTTNSLNTSNEQFTTEWKGQATNGAFGNSSITMNYSRDNRTCIVNLSFIRGSTASLPTGAWSFTIPFKALTLSTGSILIKSSTGTFRSATWRVFGGSNEIFIFLDGATGAMDETSLSFGTNGTMDAQVAFQIASS